MYEKHFGLERSPFRAKAIGTDVFVGPQTASTMAGFRKALTAQDAVVTVSGPVGTGKTTLVERAVDAMGTKYKTIRVGRMAMNSSDVLEALLVVLGVQERPAGTIQRFATLRKKLKELQDRDVRVFILIEDALRAGVDTLAELEALTAADAGESDGASIVLMGDERLGEFMQSPALGQLQQRIRQRHTIYPQCGAEMRAYFMHCFRQVGGDFEHIFDDRSVALLKELSGGIPRIANNLIESSLAAAAAKGLDQIPSTLIAEVAADEYGLSVDNFDFTTPIAEDSAALDSAETDTAPSADDSQHSNHHTLPDLEILSPNYEKLAMGDDDNRGAADVNEPEVEVDDEVIAEPEAEVIDEVIAEPEAEVVDEVIAEPEAEVVDEVIAEPEAEVVDEVIAEPETEVVDEVIPTLDPEVIAEFIPEPEAEVLAEQSPEAQPPQDKTEEVVPQLLPDPVEVVVADIDPITAPELEVTGDMASEFESVPGPDEAEMPIPEPVAAIAPEPRAEDIPELVPELSQEPLAESIPDLQPEPEPQAVADNIPELLPELEPEPFADLDPELMPEPAPEPVAEVVPELVADHESVLANEKADVSDSPEWEQDPTFAELKPDLEALEQAMAFAQGGSAKKSAQATDDGGSLYDRVTMYEEMPEITLDKTIETGIEKIQADDAGESRPMTPLKKSAVELDKIAAEIGMASTLEDFDDKMAETLFGTGISMIAAQLTMKPPTREPANDEIQLELDTPIQAAAGVPEEPAAAGVPEEPAAAGVPEEPAAAGPVNSISEEVTLETMGTPPNSGAMLLTATQRLKTVRALNAHPAASSRKAKSAADVDPADAGAPAPIEDQIKTSITQTLKALEIPEDLEDDEPEDQPKRGFFSRFRRS